MPRPLYRGFRGDQLRELRERRGWTQEALAVRLGTPSTAVGKWERGLVQPEPAQVRRLAAALEVPPQEFTSVPMDEARVTDLRTWAGLTRSEAAEQSGVPVRRLFHIEHLTSRPTGTEARELGRVYGVSAGVLLAVWDRERAEAYPDAPTVQSYTDGGVQ